MPCYHFTFHAYGTWMPDKKKGYVKRKKGVLPSDERMAQNYRANQKQPTVKFLKVHQEAIAAILRVVGQHLDATMRCIAIEPTHLHVIVSWSHERAWDSMRQSIRSALTRNLNDRFGKREWFVKGASRKQIQDHDHFCYLIREYLPSHRGVFWLRDEDMERFG
ncbi:MAG: hypothetical protein AB8C95_01425 [Phycisphaeraceae bacterium]